MFQSYLLKITWNLQTLPPTNLHIHTSKSLPLKPNNLDNNNNMVNFPSNPIIQAAKIHFSPLRSDFSEFREWHPDHLTVVLPQTVPNSISSTNHLSRGTPVIIIVAPTRADWIGARSAWASGKCD
jgi:hypothetical protein